MAKFNYLAPAQLYVHNQGFVFDGYLSITILGTQRLGLIELNNN